MSSAPAVPAVHVSWIKKLGQDVVKVLKVIAGLEPIAEPIVEALIPASIPAFAIFDKIMQIVISGEAAFAAVGQASNGPAKLAAALPQVQNLLDQWVQDNLPGSAQILSAESYVANRVASASGYINAAVAFLNSIPGAAHTAVSSPALAAASAAAAAVKAAGH